MKAKFKEHEWFHLELLLLLLEPISLRSMVLTLIYCNQPLRAVDDLNAAPCTLKLQTKAYNYVHCNDTKSAPIWINMFLDGISQPFRPYILGSSSDFHRVVASFHRQIESTQVKVYVNVQLFSNQKEPHLSRVEFFFHLAQT